MVYCWCLCTVCSVYPLIFLYLRLCADPCLFPLLCYQKAALVCAMEMVGALWVTMAGTVCASWAGGALAVTPLWKLPAVMSRTTMEVKITNHTLQCLQTLAIHQQGLLTGHDFTIKLTTFVLANILYLLHCFSGSVVPLHRSLQLYMYGGNNNWNCLNVLYRAQTLNSQEETCFCKERIL